MISTILKLKYEMLLESALLSKNRENKFLSFTYNFFIIILIALFHFIDIL